LCDKYHNRRYIEMMIAPSFIFFHGPHVVQNDVKRVLEAPHMPIRRTYLPSLPTATKREFLGWARIASGGVCALVRYGIYWVRTCKKNLTTRRIL
jgi:hypothetical protein